GLARPELVEALVLVSTTAGIEDASERDARRRSDAALAEKIESGGDEGLAAFLDEWLSGPLFAGLPPAAANLPARLVNRAAGLSAALRTLGTGCQEPLWDRLGELSMPVLVLAGERDDKFVTLGKRLAAAIGANSSFEIVQGAGHACCFERPGHFAELVATFATSTRSSAGAPEPGGALGAHAPRGAGA
ncbi:MAG: hypothetical protein ACRD0B_09265, partial [Acidimicrobiales bacterium]